VISGELLFLEGCIKITSSVYVTNRATDSLIACRCSVADASYW